METLVMVVASLILAVIFAGGTASIVYAFKQKNNRVYYYLLGVLNYFVAVLGLFYLATL